MKYKGSFDTMDGTENKGSMEAGNETKNRDGMDTMEDDEMDGLLKAAFSQMVEQEYKERRKEFPKHQFSPQFEHSMEELLRTGRIADKAEKKDKREFSLLALMRPIRSRRVVLAMVVLMVCLFGATVSGTNPIIIWLHDSWMEQHGDYVELESREKEEKPSQGEFKKYELTQIPDGYKMEEEFFDENIGIYYMYYINEEGSTFTFCQSKKENGNLGNITADRKDMEQVRVDEFEGYYVKDREAENFVLSSDEYMLLFSGNFSKKEFLTMAESLQLVK